MSLTSFPFPKFFWGTTFAFFLYFLYVATSSATTHAPSPNIPPMDPYKLLHIILNPNGTLTRLDKPPQSPPSSDPKLPVAVLSKDVTVNRSKNIWVRIYLPRKALDNHHYSLAKLPLIVFFHGGGFIFHSAASTYFHDFCVTMANDVQAVVVSVNYRLAPEHRLPAAYDDSMEALHWIKTSKDVWLTRYADYSTCYLMGESAGGNIAYIAGLRAAAEVDQLKPLRIEGLILVQPFFGGIKRTPSELRLANDNVIAQPITDLMWELSLPIGANRDHEYCNPMVKSGSKILDQISLLGWKILVFGCDGDPLVDREKQLAELLKDKGVQVWGKFHAGGHHGVFIGDAQEAKKMCGVIRSVVTQRIA